MEISNYFLNAMRAKGLTYQKVGERLGMSRQNVHKLLHEKKNKNWRDVEIEKWCRVLGANESVVRGLWQRESC